MENKVSLPCSQKPASSPKAIRLYIDWKNLFGEELHEIKITVEKCGQIVIYVICDPTTFVKRFKFHEIVQL
jgi:hypothetical protein